MAQKTLKERNIAGTTQEDCPVFEAWLCIKDTCQIVGINPETVYRWLNEALRKAMVRRMCISHCFCDFQLNARGIGVRETWDYRQLRFNG